jgi:catechol 2,3-dioxygenase-like lactoylglutathione lyase family enzyme
VKAHRVSAVVCSGDLARSQTFYEQVVGLTLSADTVLNHLLFECGDGTTILVYGRPAPNKADHTQVRFWTDDDGHDKPPSRLYAVATARPNHRSLAWARVLAVVWDLRCALVNDLQDEPE